jgi:hypothetical protein
MAVFKYVCCLLVSIVLFASCKCADELQINLTSEKVKFQSGETPEELGCTAAKTSGEIFKADKKVFSAIHSFKGGYTARQAAMLRGRKTSVEAVVGGCVHYSHTFNIKNLRIEEGATDQQLLEGAIALLKKLPLSKIGQDSLKVILSPMEKHQFKMKNDECQFIETPGYSWVDCSISRTSQATADFQIYYTIAL